MLRPDGLKGADFRAYLRALRNPTQTAQWHMRLTDLNGNHRSSITTDAMGGQVLGDMHHFGQKYGPTRKLTLDIFDPDGTLDVQAKTSAAAQSLFLSTLVHVDQVTRVDELGEHVHCPLFVGRPTDSLDRTGAVVSVTAADKAVLGMGQCWKPLHIGRGTPKVDAIRQILSERMGETRFDFPANMDKPRLHKSISMGRMHRPLPTATRIAESMDMQLFWRGDVCTLRHWPRRPLYTFDPEQEIVGEVQARTTLHGFDNLVEMLGHRPHGAKHRIRAVARPNPGVAWSPEDLAYGGVPGFHVLRQKHPHMRSQREVQRKADRLLEDHLDAVAGEITLDVIPLPFLEEGDKYRAKTIDGDHAHFRLRSFALPIGLGDGEAPAMSLNFHKQPRAPRHELRRHHRGA